MCGTDTPSREERETEVILGPRKRFSPAHKTAVKHRPETRVGVGLVDRCHGRGNTVQGPVPGPPVGPLRLLVGRDDVVSVLTPPQVQGRLIGSSISD